MPRVEAAEAEQLCLFDLGPNMQKIREAALSFKQATRAKNTMIAYDLGWKYFSEWCQQAGRQALPASSKTVADYVAARLDEGLKCTSLEGHMAAIAFRHKRENQPVPSREEARTILRGAKRLRQETPTQKCALTTDELRKISRRLEAKGTPTATRDRAIVLLGVATGLRRTNLAMLTMEDIRFVPRKGVAVTVRGSKTDQNGLGEVIGVRRGRHAETCPVRALRAWIGVRGEKPGGPLFIPFTPAGVKVFGRHIDGETVNRAVKGAVELVSLAPERYGGHSLRATCVTAAHLSGAATLTIMERTGHKSVAMVHKYLRNADPFAGPDPLARAL